MTFGQIEPMNDQRFFTYVAIAAAIIALAMMAGATSISSHSVFIASIAGEGACFYILYLMRETERQDKWVVP